MHKILRNISMSIVAVGMLVAVVVLPIVKMAGAWADTTLTFNFNVSNTDNAPVLNLTAYLNNFDNAVGTNVDGNGLIVTVEGQDGFFGITPVDGTNTDVAQNRITVNCSSNQSCSVEISGVDTSDNSQGIHFSTPGGSPFKISYLNGGEYLAMQTNLLTSESFVITYREVEEFDGNAYAIWACGDNDEEICLHLLTDLNTGNNTTTYFAASTITDVANNTRTFDQFGKFEDEDYVRGMATKKSVDDWVKSYTHNDSATISDVDWSQVDIHKFLRGEDKGEWERKLIEEGVCDGGADRQTLESCVDTYFEEHDMMDRGVKLQPVGETQGESSYTSYGDRNFRITIYDDSYKAIELGSINDLYYVPNYYQDETFVDAIDISGTTPESPAVMHSVLLEQRVRIKASTVGGLAISNIVALDVPELAVDINPKDDESYEFTFNSNYYDRVVFKITDEDGGEYYLRVERSILDTWVFDRGVRTTFTFDSSTSYSDYEIVATYAYNDGSFVEKIMENAEAIDDGLGNMTYLPEMEGGQHLKIATYKIEEQEVYWDNLEGVYFTVRRVGSTETIFAGTLTGSGLGVYEEVHNH